jgi:hypothetical protein
MELRKKDPDFPINGGRPLPTPQPSLMTHVGIETELFTPILAFMVDTHPVF